MKTFIQIVSICACMVGSAFAADPTPAEAEKGLKSALGSIVDQALAVSSDAKATSSELSIALPEKLQKLESTLRGLGQGQLMDDFKAKVKKVAMDTLPLTKDAFKGETSGVKVEDPMTVLKAAPDGLTNFTKQKTRQPILTKVQPLIAAKSKESGLAASYQAMVAKAGPMASAMFGKEPPANLEQSVTEQTVDFVYGQMGKGEAALRANPSLSKDALVKKLFSAVKK
ncbi:MAG: DUF4197 family protein [Nibricoccus sp.]